MCGYIYIHTYIIIICIHTYLLNIPKPLTLAPAYTSRHVLESLGATLSNESLGEAKMASTKVRIYYDYFYYCHCYCFSYYLLQLDLDIKVLVLLLLIIPNYLHLVLPSSFRLGPVQCRRARRVSPLLASLKVDGLLAGR